MKCVWTQKVSLLIDGELDRAESREVEQHLDACGDCREAQADFLSLRRQLAAYQVDLDAFAAQRALKRILASGASGATREGGRNDMSSRRGEGRFAGVFGMPRLSPVGLGALLLLLVGVAAGIVSLINTRRPAVEVAKTTPTPTPQNEVRNNSNGNAQPAPEIIPGAGTTGTKEGGETMAGNNRKEFGEASTKNGGLSAANARTRGRLPRTASAGDKVKKSSPSLNRVPSDLPFAETARNNGAVVEGGVETLETSDAGDDLTARRGREAAGDSKTARHVEQAQLLLRSFRNARLSDAGRRASSDFAYDKRQSKRLLYQNIVLRREAASRGNLPVESLLDSLEPILIDIANLPDKPAPEDVREINERMRRKNLVAMLQISSVESAS
ncbi:MAG TPA: zf-HC2 domain-containing protein, partial [Pyrinomonadaceae bacterium]